MDNDSLLLRDFLGNPLRAWLMAALAFAAYQGAGLFFKNVVLARLRRLAEKTETKFDDVLVDALGGIRSVELAVVALYLSTRSLYLSDVFDRGLRIALVVVATFRVAALLQSIVAYLWQDITASARKEDATAASALSNLEYVFHGAVWLGAVLFILENLGVNITTAVAGLGIGGIAVAMAAQQILGDLFSSFVIFMDKPFRIGDFIVVDALSGTVEHVGIKTTQVRSLSGEMLIFANSDLTKSRIRNFKRMKERRAVLSFGVPYDTPRDKAALVPAMIRDVFKGMDKVRFDRAHLKGFGVSALEYEAVWHVLSDDYALYMDLNQKLSLELMERFAAEGIRFAVAEKAVHVSA